MRALLLACVALVLLGAQAAAAPAPRIAVLVGANQAVPGRRPLRYAYRDAEQMADVLATVGGFDRANVHILRDPDPRDVLATVKRELAGLAGRPDSVFYFYYSGHADGQALYPSGRSLSLDELRAAIDDARVTVRIGLMDACQGSGWTRAKGLHAEEPFEVKLPVNLANEGSVLIASSSGLESAHESDQLQGSFFTMHFTAGLRGAADRNQDGEVTLTEAFDYAKSMTIRDTARYATEPQHPSYAVNLRGRKDLVMAQIAASPSSVSLTQSEGPLQVIHLDTGLQLLEVPAGRREVKLAVPAGRYLVRKLTSDGNYAREIKVAAGSTNLVSEQQLVLTGLPNLSRKGGDPTPRETATTVAPHIIEHRIALGISNGVAPGATGSQIQLQAGGPDAPTFDVRMLSAWGLTSRLTWSIATGAFAYRFGDRGKVETVPWGGLLGFQWGGQNIGCCISLKIGLGIDARFWIAPDHSLVLTSGARSDVIFSGNGTEPPRTWRVFTGFGYVGTFKNLVTLHLGMVASENLFYLGQVPTGGFDDLRLGFAIDFGAVQSLGLRDLPLLQFHLSPMASLDLYASAGYQLAVYDYPYPNPPYVPGAPVASSTGHGRYQAMVGTTVSW